MGVWFCSEGDPEQCHQVLGCSLHWSHPQQQVGRVSVMVSFGPLDVSASAPSHGLAQTSHSAGAKRVALCVPAGAAAGTCFPMLGIDVFCFGHME